MAREARKTLADLRAMEEQHAWREMHGAGKQFYGAGATPSMGLSQFRGGARKCKCGAEESDSEPEYEGAGRFQFRIPRLTAPRPVSTALVPRPSAGPIIPLGPAGRPVARPSLPASYYSNLFRGQPAARAGLPAAGTAAAARGSLLSRLRQGVTGQRLATAATLGTTLGMLGSYLGDQSGASGDAGYYDDYAGGLPGGPAGPAGPSGPIVDYGPPGGVDVDGDGIPDAGGESGVPADLSQDELAWYLQSGNLPERYSLRSRRRGRGKVGGAKKKSGARSARAAVVSKVMKERGVSLPEASRIVKAEGLY